MQQPLHSITAAEYARAARASRDAEIFRVDGDGWVVVHDGHLRSARLDDPAARVDVGGSSGIWGFGSDGRATYIHLDPSGRSSIRMGETGAALYVRTATALDQVQWLSASKIQFTVHDFRPVQVEVGMAAKQSCLVSVDGVLREMVSDERGVLKLDLPAKAEVVVESR